MEKFDIARVHDRNSPEARALETSIDETLERVFGAGTTDYLRYAPAASLYNGPVFFGGGPTPPHEVQEYFRDGKSKALALLNQAVRGLQELSGDEEPGTRAWTH